MRARERPVLETGRSMGCARCGGGGGGVGILADGNHAGA